ncbi:MAG: LytTR family DNA-binding domain-containing protein, partial [Bacteroidia bacterium]|nr:LytTR family DNA-binding domain-containing protein [Bacteroidia bacterium]
KYLLFSVWTAILVGSIPVTISYIVTFNKIYKTALKEAAIPPEEILWESEVIIRAGNPKNEFKFNPKNIVYLCSNDNYVTIVTIKGDAQNKTTIRGTLKSAETELRKNSRFLRCHKCYIVNLDFVDRVTGHNQNMKIRLLPGLTEIPVSRSKADLVNKKTKKG